MAQMSITITGLPELIAKCKKPIHAAPIRKAFTDSVLDLEAKAKSLTPRMTGNLQRSITHKIDGAAIPTFAQVGLLGGGPVGKSGARYGVYVHEGTRPHTIVARRAKALHFNGRFARRVRHPGTAANPFLRNALQAMSGAIQANFTAAAKAIEAAWGGR